VPPEQWHTTLAFLGDVPDARVDKARHVLDRAAGELTPAGPAVRISGGGTFGKGRFTMLWAGLRGDIGAVAGLAGALMRELRAAHLPHDRKQFRPHVTVARPGDRVTADELAADLAALDGYQSPLWTVDGVRLMCSHLGPRPWYEVVHEVDLATG
jgi:2'-5' RNA ligase